MSENDDVNEQVQNPTFSWQVPSSTQIDPYTVLTDNVNWSCTCLGYFYRGDCRHIKQIKENFDK